MPMSNEDWDFGRATAVSEESVYILSYWSDEPEEGEDENEEVTQVVGWSDGNMTSFILPWIARDVCRNLAKSRHDVVLGRYGEALVFSDAGSRSEVIAPGLDGPAGLGVLRDIRVIGQHVYACGMSRQVYKRECEDDVLSGNWSRVDEGCVLPAPSGEVVGFTSLDGFEENEIYAAGWRGELWQFDGSTWSSIPSITDAKLERLICAPDGSVYIAGQAGVLIRGRGDRWELIDQDATNDQFWGMDWYEDRLWLATGKGLYVLDKEMELLKIDSDSFGEDPTFGHLTSAGRRIWSVGTHHVFVSKDGDSWTQVFLSSPAGRP